MADQGEQTDLEVLLQACEQLRGAASWHGPSHSHRIGDTAFRDFCNQVKRLRQKHPAPTSDTAHG